MIHDFRGATSDYILSELERRKGDLRTQLVWIGVQKEPGFTSRTWKWVNGECHSEFNSIWSAFGNLNCVRRAIHYVNDRRDFEIDANADDTTN